MTTKAEGVATLKFKLTGKQNFRLLNLHLNSENPRKAQLKFWEELGKEMGFDPKTVVAVNDGDIDPTFEAEMVEREEIVEKEVVLAVPKEKQILFDEAVRPLIKYLCENHHPHVTVMVDCGGAQILEGIYGTKIEDYILD